MAFDLKDIIASRLGENYELHERHLNRTLVSAQRVIGFDKVYARAEGAYLYDMDDIAYLDFLSGYSVFNIGRNHPAVKKAIRDVLDLDLPNMVQMDCSLLSGLLAEAIIFTEATVEPLLRATEEEIQRISFTVRWGSRYDPEMLLEHAVCHVLRHRRQLERW